MKTIFTNSIRVYHVDPVKHDGCMKALDNAGIYLWLDLDTFNTTILQSSPKWTKEQFIDFTYIMDNFQQYDNLGGSWVGNEFINTASGSPPAPYIKAAVADMKAYFAAKAYRMYLWYISPNFNVSPLQGQSVYPYLQCRAFSETLFAFKSVMQTPNRSDTHRVLGD
jgi:hypothetical protein